MSFAAPSPRRAHVLGCGWFWAWAAVGALGVFAFVSFLLGVFALVPAAVAGFALSRVSRARVHAHGLLTGAGLPLLLVAYVQRDGPGTTCWHTATAAGCDQHLNPLPWLVTGAGLVIAGLVGEVLRARRG